MTPTRRPLRTAQHAALAGLAMFLAFASVLASAVQAQEQRNQLAPAESSAEGSSAPLPDAPASPPATDKLSGDLLLGKWCGETTNYLFSTTELTVTFHSGGSRVLRIDHINTGDTWIDVHWVGKRPDGGSNNTVFQDFSADGNVMFQAANVGGDKGPRRRFRRC